MCTGQNVKIYEEHAILLITLFLKEQFFIQERKNEKTI